MDDEEDEPVEQKKQEDAPPRRRPKKLIIPRRIPSEVIPPRSIIYPTPDKNTCAECTCFPKEDPYVKPKKINPCQKSPLTLYELAAEVVDKLKFPEVLTWTEAEAADWMEKEVGMPQYRECILNNHIDGMRLLKLEDPSHMPEINLRYFDDMTVITKKVRQLYSTEFIRFARSIGLPPRKPLAHCTWFKSRTGPSWGIAQNWSRCDILRWMKIIMPAPLYLDHWDLVWYHKPDFPRTKFARIPEHASQVHIPHYKHQKDICYEYLTPRRFRLQANIPDEEQMIWMERRPSEIKRMEEEKKKKELRLKTKTMLPKKTRLDPKRISLTGLSGKDLLLARRKMPIPKFMPGKAKPIRQLIREPQKPQAPKNELKEDQ